MASKFSVRDNESFRPQTTDAERVANRSLTTHYARETLAQASALTLKLRTTSRMPNRKAYVPMIHITERAPTPG
jgi:hypothetical protein